MTRIVEVTQQSETGARRELSAVDDSDPRHDAGAGDTVRALRPSGRRLLVAGAVMLAIICLLALLGYGVLSRQGNGFGVNAVSQLGRVQGGPAPDFQIQLYNGKTFRLSAQRGHAVLVNYWASWCAPCRDEASVLQRAWQQYQGRGIRLVGLDIWDSEKDARTFMREFGVRYPTGPDLQGSAAIDYGVSGIPETFFIRRDGTMARHWIGPLTDQQVNAFVQELLS